MRAAKNGHQLTVEFLVSKGLSQCLANAPLCVFCQINYVLDTKYLVVCRAFCLCGILYILKLNF